MRDKSGNVMPAEDLRSMLTRTMQEPYGDYQIVTDLLPGVLVGAHRAEKAEVREECAADLEVIGGVITKFYGGSVEFVMPESDEQIDAFVADARETRSKAKEFAAAGADGWQSSVFAGWAAKVLLQKHSVQPASLSDSTPEV